MNDEKETKELMNIVFGEDILSTEPDGRAYKSKIYIREGVDSVYVLHYSYETGHTVLIYKYFKCSPEEILNNVFSYSDENSFEMLPYELIGEIYYNIKRSFWGAKEVILKFFEDEREYLLGGLETD